MATHTVEYPVHKRPTTDVSVTMMLTISAGFTVAVYAALWPMTDTFVRDLFIGRTGYFVDRLIFCGLLTYMLSLSLVNVILKAKKIRDEKSVMDEDIIPGEVDYNNAEQIRGIHQRVMQHPRLIESLWLTRLARVLAVWLDTENLDRTTQTAREETDLDSFSSDSSYRLNRLFIWALPVLGFIGTVYGVSLAVSNFAGFLSGAVTPEAIKTQVGLITTGLGVAFYTTLLGLIFATIAAFSSLLMERNEERLLESIDAYVQDNLLLRMPSTAEKEFPIEQMVSAIREGMEGIQEHMKFPVDELAQAIDAGFRRLPNPDRYEEVFTRAIAKAGDIINQKYEEFQTNYERRVGELGSQLGGKLDGVANNFNSGTQRMAEEFRKTQERNLEIYSKNEQKLSERFDELTEQIANLGKEQNEQFGEAHDRYLEAVEELSRKEIQRWEKMVADFNQLSARLAEQFKQAVTTLDSASARYSERIQASADALGEQLERITQIGNEVDKVLRTTQSMEATLRQVGSSDEFRQTLANLRSHLTTSDELLKQLSRPRKVVFQEARMDEGM